MSNIKVTDDIFYSIQGEGETVGAPSVFLRLGMCTLECKWCDTIRVWNTFKNITIGELYDIFDREKLFEHINSGAHLVITGGSPLMQQKSIVEFLQLCSVKNPVIQWIIECETEGTIKPSAQMFSAVNQWNVSPKLSNSEMPLTRRYKPDVLDEHLKMASNRTCWKFVVASIDDVLEARAIVKKHSIDPEKVYLMPQVTSIKEYREMADKVIKWCKHYHFNFTPRLQVVVWDKTTGV